MPADFSMAPDEAYRSVLCVLPAGQRWFSFDVAIADARAGRAKRFGMTLWNFHTTNGREFEAWAITRDKATGTFWYRVRKERRGEPPSRNRKSLWDALQLAATQEPQIPMNGILKDGGHKRWCAPKHVFPISDVRMQADGSALWLKLDVTGDDVGTMFSDQLLPAMLAVPKPKASPSAQRRAAVLPLEQYLAARDAAVKVVFEGADRSEAISGLVSQSGLNESTASALLNNFRCLVRGIAFKAPMRAAGLQVFIDAIVARLGDVALPNVVAATQSYVDYAEKEWGSPSVEMREILAGLVREQERETLLRQVIEVVNQLPPSVSDNQAPSEILREVWVRGPQHAAFKRELVRRWAGKCSVHGASCNDQLRASHIVAWSLDAAIRGDVNNGLLLSVPLDSLFDRGLISFDDSGNLITSQRLAPETAHHFGLQPGLRIAWDQLKDHEQKALRANLTRHRNVHGNFGRYV